MRRAVTTTLTVTTVAALGLGLGLGPVAANASGRDDGGYSSGDRGDRGDRGKGKVVTGATGTRTAGDRPGR